MFGKFRQDEIKYDDAIERLLGEMNTYDPDTPEYRNALEALERVTKIKAESRKSKVSADTAAIVLGNLVGILIIVAYEQKHAWTSKASVYIKPKEPRI